jgi:pyrrolysine biosynthesis protein PylD
MTRLHTSDIANIAVQLESYDDELVAKTGHNMRQIACHAVQMSEPDGLRIIPRIRAGVVPIQWGQGLIGGFSEATAGILRFLGFDTFVTAQTDISGLAEACETKADVIFLSDDNDFIAINLNARRHIHNADATGKGFAAGLDLMAGGVTNQKVLVLGCGAVGRSATSALLKCGAQVSIYDINQPKSRQLADSIIGPDSDRIMIEQEMTAALSGHSLIVDATNAAAIIHACDITPQTCIAAPGMPLGLSPGALIKVSDRLLHDPLQIGVATMGMAVVKQLLVHK